MAENVTKLRVFVASPGDVLVERKKLAEVIDELNHGIAGAKGIMLQLIGWETDAWPGVAVDPQAVINQQIEGYDIFIGIMWKRFGTPTKRAGSGTAEEFEQAYHLWETCGTPRIMLYFSKTNFYPSSLDEAIQVGKVLEFKKKAMDKGVLYWEYNSPKEFEKFVRMHLLKEITRWENFIRPPAKPPIPRLPLQFYRVLFDDMQVYINQFGQLQRDYERELNGESLEFAVDFSEIHNYMYPYSVDSPRASLNQYVFNALENPLTLMPGAVGELLTDLERMLPPDEILEQDPMVVYEDVAAFINRFPRVMDNEEQTIRLYSRAEKQLKETWGELFHFVVQDDQNSALKSIRSLIDRHRLSPINGVQEITTFPPEVRQKMHWVKSHLNLERPGRTRNNNVDTIDFAVTWLLNRQKRDKRDRYLSIYTQSTHLINVCTATHQLQFDDDYLVRDADYFKFRTKLQELFPEIWKRQEFVIKWATHCRRLQAEIPNLMELDKEPSKLKKPSLVLLDLYRQFDEECRIPLTFTGELTKERKSEIPKKASELYKTLKAEGKFKGRTNEAFDVLKMYLHDLQTQLGLFAPEKTRAKDSKDYMEKLAIWLDAETWENGDK